jgi:hypothetical protein
MGLRFRRSVRLFPGVRLNFSRSGVSTSIGVRGATMTLGPRGTYANVGILGSGLSYRTRLDTPSRTHQRAPNPVPTWSAPPPPRSPIRAAGVASIPGTEVEIKSADVGVLTSPGLGELKELINEAISHHAELTSQLAQHKKALARAAGRLRRAQSLVVRLFTAKSIPRLVEAANNALDQFDDTQSHLEGCFVEVDFAFDEATRNSYAALVQAFEGVKSAQRIWDITATAAVDRVTQRTTAASALTRVPVTFDFMEPKIIRSQYRVMRLGNIAGRDLQIFAGFVMMRAASQDFALIELSQLDCQLANSNFIEEETVPSDAERAGTTWKRANKDGSQDRRFNNNYPIPVMRYGALAFSSPSGLAAIFQISSYAKAAAFAYALDTYKRALANLNNARADPQALPGPSDGADSREGEAEPAPVFVAKPRTGLVVDWVVLALLVAGVGFGGIWTTQHWSKTTADTPAPAHVEAAPSAAPPQSPRIKHRSRPSRHHAASSTSTPTRATPTETAPAGLSQFSPPDSQ